MSHKPSPPQGASHGQDSVHAARLLEAVIAPVVKVMGYEVVLVEWVGGTGARVLRVYVDHADGVDLDACARLSRIVGNALDAAEEAERNGSAVGGAGVSALLGSKYMLEVSSPGIDRPLAKLAEFARFIGKEIVLRTFEPIDASSKQKVFHGFIESVEPDLHSESDPYSGFVSLRGKDPLVSGGERPLYRFSLAQIRKANLVFEG